MKWIVLDGNWFGSPSAAPQAVRRSYRAVTRLIPSHAVIQIAAVMALITWATDTMFWAGQ